MLLRICNALGSADEGSVGQKCDNVNTEHRYFSVDDRDQT
jgi:hypothetical protein